MRKTLLIAGFLFLPVTVAAQEAPRAELFGGYSYFRADGGGNLHGWNASIAGNVSGWFGLVADFSGHYGSQSLRVQGPGMVFIDADADADVHNFLAGPRFSYRKNERLTPFAHALFGVARAHVDGRGRPRLRRSLPAQSRTPLAAPRFLTRW